MSEARWWWAGSLLAAIVLGGVLLFDLPRAALERLPGLRAPETAFSGQVVSLAANSQPCNPVVSPGNAGGCAVSAGDRVMRLRLQGDVRPLRPFELSLQLPSGVRVSRASVDFVMVGMDMGVNRYALALRPDGDFGARVILPVCSIGRSDWAAKVSVAIARDSGAAEMWTADFPFSAEPSVGAHDE